MAAAVLRSCAVRAKFWCDVRQLDPHSVPARCDRGTAYPANLQSSTRRNLSRLPQRRLVLPNQGWGVGCVASGGRVANHDWSVTPDHGAGCSSPGPRWDGGKPDSVRLERNGTGKRKLRRHDRRRTTVHQCADFAKSQNLVPVRHLSQAVTPPRRGFSFFYNWAYSAYGFAQRKAFSRRPGEPSDDQLAS